MHSEVHLLRLGCKNTVRAENSKDVGIDYAASLKISVMTLARSATAPSIFSTFFVIIFIISHPFTVRPTSVKRAKSYPWFRQQLDSLMQKA
jgi:hypothetical protein